MVRQSRFPYFGAIYNREARDNSGTRMVRPKLCASSAINALSERILSGGKTRNCSEKEAVQIMRKAIKASVVLSPKSDLAAFGKKGSWENLQEGFRSYRLPVADEQKPFPVVIEVTESPCC